MNKFLSIQEAAKCLGVSPQTLRRWEKAQKIKPSHHTEGVQRRYDFTLLRPFDRSNKTSDRPTMAYACVSSHDQKRGFTTPNPYVRNLLLCKRLDFFQ